MDRLKEFFFTFSGVTTGSLLSAAIFLTVFYTEEDVSSNILWQILLTSFICTLGNLLYPRHKLTRKQLYQYSFLHYIYINIVVIGSGLYYEWFYIDHFPMIFVMVLSIAIVFLILTFISHERAKKDTEKLNARLREYKRKKQES